MFGVPETITKARTRDFENSRMRERAQAAAAAGVFVSIRFRDGGTRPPLSRFSRNGIPILERRCAMTIQQMNDRHYDWKHLVDYETFWILAFSTVVLGSGIFALLSIFQNSPYAQ
jgi:hypothetical protein